MLSLQTPLFFFQLQLQLHAWSSTCAKASVAGSMLKNRTCWFSLWSFFISAGLIWGEVRVDLQYTRFYTDSPLQSIQSLAICKITKSKKEKKLKKGRKKKLQRQRKSVFHSSWSCLHASSLSYTDKCSRHSTQDEPPPQREASLTCGRQFSYLFQNWNQVQPVLGWKMLEDPAVPTGYEGHRLKELARCSVVVCFSPGNCVLRYDRPRRRHKQAINANTRTWFNERAGVEALEHLVKRLSYCGHTRTKILLQGWRISPFASFSFISNNGGQAVPSASHCFETWMLWKKKKRMHSSTITVNHVYNHLAEAARLYVFTLPAPCSPAMMWMVWKVMQQWSRDSS